jgi:hypothetical protein
MDGAQIQAISYPTVNPAKAVLTRARDPRDNECARRVWRGMGARRAGLSNWAACGEAHPGLDEWAHGGDTFLVR